MLSLSRWWRQRCTWNVMQMITWKLFKMILSRNWTSIRLIIVSFHFFVFSSMNQVIERHDLQGNNLVQLNQPSLELQVPRCNVFFNTFFWVGDVFLIFSSCCLFEWNYTISQGGKVDRETNTKNQWIIFIMKISISSKYTSD